MKNAVIVHGKPSKKEYFGDKYPSSSNFGWLPWLQKKLVQAGVDAQTPEMLNAWRPEYEIWKKEFERYDLNPETALVGHSCGGGFLVRWLSENKDVKVGKVILVAPWTDPDKEYTRSTGFFEFEIDADLAKRTSECIVFVSDDDADDIHKTVENLGKKVRGLKVRQFKGYGHFVPGHMKREDFPELLEELLK
jgi:predicted alpha/beta hydrolase family esterase